MVNYSKHNAKSPESKEIYKEISSIKLVDMYHATSAPQILCTFKWLKSVLSHMDMPLHTSRGFPLQSSTIMNSVLAQLLSG